MVLRSEIIDGKKFMWDGNEYANEDEAQAAMKEYEGNGFETRLKTDSGSIEVFTRRLVTEIVLEGEAPL
jgi:hypothetical protein